MSRDPSGSDYDGARSSQPTASLLGRHRELLEKIRKAILVICLSLVVKR